jgi:hypothetical protein
VSDLATLETALRRDRAYARLAGSHVHRATREDSLCLIKGRDAITAAWVNEDASDITMTADLGEMIAYKVKGWHGHRWVWREEGRILREVVIEDRGEAKVAAPVHPPLGELRSGQGQYAPSDAATLPPGFPEASRDIANWLHQAWNGRAFDLYDRAPKNREWLPALVRTLPDATFHFEHAIVGEKQTAILWRVHGHHAGGQRVRLIGSSVFTGDADETVIDQAAMAAQVARGVIEYAGGEEAGLLGGAGCRVSLGNLRKQTYQSHCETG